MALLVPNEGEAKILGTALGKVTQENLVLKLFTNNVTPTETDTAATYTEAAGGGYVSKSLTGANWTVTPGAPTQAAYPQQAWTFTGALTGAPTIYGYFIVGESTGTLFWVELLGAPYTPLTSGDVARVTPIITLD